MSDSTTAVKLWETASPEVFWSEIAPHDHVVQLYEDDQAFFDALFGFVKGGILSGESVIIIATEAHRHNLQEKLKSQGFDLLHLRESGIYVERDAEETLSGFLIKDWPDRTLFKKMVYSLLEPARKNNRKVRAFGEMVAVLWEKGCHGATVYLESLWNDIHKEDKFSLFCAYPKSGFTMNRNEAMSTICSCHTKMLSGSHHQVHNIYYRTLLPA